MYKYLGLVVSQGEAKGEAVIVDDNYENKILPPKTILITKALTRKLLVNLPPNVVGIVAEIGNIGSHGAGILRQKKIPCIVRISNITSYIKDGTVIEINGKSSCVLLEDGVNKEHTISNESTVFSYFSISKPGFTLSNIRPVENWYMPRPDRQYQLLRYDMIKDVYVAGTKYLFNMTEPSVRRAPTGQLEIYGTPYIPDLCSFELSNPEWLLLQSKERTAYFDEIKNTLHLLYSFTSDESLINAIKVFRESVKAYQSLFRYVFLAQVTSDELLDVYIDFVYQLTGNYITKDVLEMKSDYVARCISSGVDPGDFQKWQDQIRRPYIWDGIIDYTPFPEDRNIMNAISRYGTNNDQLLNDYQSFRIIIPLLYQLSEEFFYMSKSINTFIQWSIVLLKNYFENNNMLNSNDNFYDLSLDYVNGLINQIQGGK